MIRINLLPEHLRPIKRTPLPYLVSGAVLILAILVVAVLGYQGHSRVSRQRGELQQHQTELEGLKGVVEEMDQLSKQKVRLADKMSIIEEIVSDRIIWSRQLFNVSRLTPDNIWYSGVSQTEKQVPVYESVMNEKTKKAEMQKVMRSRRFLVLTGYVTPASDGSIETTPMLFKMEQDPEFSKMFTLTSPTVKDTIYDKYQVKTFTLELEMTQVGGGGK